jgi:hypothetical protein
VQTLTASTANISQGSAILTQGTIATLNSTTGTIAGLSATTSTFLGTITGSTNVINIGSGQVYKDASGNVGIGITNPQQLLAVGNGTDQIGAGISGAVSTLYLGTPSNASGGIKRISYERNTGNLNFIGGTVASPSNQVTLDNNGSVGIAGGSVSITRASADYNVIALVNTSGVEVQLNANGNTEGNLRTVTNHPLSFTTNNIERVRIDSTGVFYVNETSTNTVSQSIISGGTANVLECETSSSASYPFLAINTATSGSNRFVYFGTEAGGSSQRGFIDYNRGSNVTRYSTTSDARLKNIIGDSSGEESISILKNTKIRDYTWKEDESAKVNVGVIAQELHNVFKGAVSVGNQITRKDSNGNDVIDEEPWGVDKTAFTFHLISGWQSHEKIIQELKSTIQGSYLSSDITEEGWETWRDFICEGDSSKIFVADP